MNTELFVYENDSNPIEYIELAVDAAEMPTDREWADSILSYLYAYVPSSVVDTLVCDLADNAGVERAVLMAGLDKLLENMEDDA